MSLLNRLERLHKESFYSWAYRSARANYLRSFVDLVPEAFKNTALWQSTNFKHAGGNWDAIIDSVAEVLGQDDTSQALLNSYNETLFSGLPNEDQMSRFYSISSTKYCPCCLRQSFHHRMDWDIRLLPMCQEHNVMLVDRCEKCHVRITHLQLMSGVCKCGFHYPDAMTQSVDSKEVLEAVQLINSAISGEQTEFGLLDQTLVSSQKFFHFLECLGRSLDGISAANQVFCDIDLGVKPEVVCYQKKNGVGETLPMAYVVTAAVRILMDPMKYMRDLALTVNDGIRKENRQALTEWLGDEDAKPYRDVLINLINDSVLPAEISYSLKIPGVQSLFLSQREATNLYNVGGLELRGTAERGEIQTYKVVNDSYELALFHESSLAEKYERRDNMIGEKKAASLLGINRMFVTNLVVMHTLQRPKGGGCQPQVTRSSVDELTNVLRSNHKLVSSVPSSSFSFAEVYVLFRLKGHSFQDLMSVVTNGQLQGYWLEAIDAPFRALRFADTDLESFVRMEDLLEIRTRRLVIGEVADIFCVPRSRVYWWTRQGKLPVYSTISVRNGVEAFTFHSADVCSIFYGLI